MARNEIIKLETNSYSTDEYGNVQESEDSWKEVFAEKKSVGYSEFYQAHAEGLKPEFKFIIHPTEYDRKENVQHIIYNGERFKIIRLYEIDSESLELTVEGDFHANA